MGAYISQSDIEAVFGTQNVAAWSVVDSTADPATANTTRIAAGIAFAEEYVEDRFRGGPYTVPFVSLGSSFPATLKDIIAKLAGGWLYKSRGVKTTTGDEVENRIGFFVRESNELIDLYMARTRKLNLQLSESGGPTAPVVVGGRPGPNSGAADRWRAKGYLAVDFGCSFPPGA